MKTTLIQRINKLPVRQRILVRAKIRRIEQFRKLSNRSYDTQIREVFQELRLPKVPRKTKKTNPFAAIPPEFFLAPQDGVGSPQLCLIADDFIRKILRRDPQQVTLTDWSNLEDFVRVPAPKWAHYKRQAIKDSEIGRLKRRVQKTYAIWDAIPDRLLDIFKLIRARSSER